VNDKLHFGFKHHTKAGDVTGTVTVYVEGPADGMQVAVERIVPHVLALPVDNVEALERKLRVDDGTAPAPFVPTWAEPSWESETLRMADEQKDYDRAVNAARRSPPPQAWFDANFDALRGPARMADESGIDGDDDEVGE
jgi:hypothetical protein